MGGGIEDGGDEHALYGRDSVDVTTPAFARRLANLLTARRRQRGCSLRSLARQSHHAFTARDLRAYEEAAVALDEEKVDVVADLYGIDLDEILVERVGLSIDPDGVLSTSGLDAAFLPHDDVSLLTAYLRLVRQMRAQQGAPTIQLRREDVEVLAAFIGESGPSVIDRLGALMGTTATQRQAMAGMFLAGAVVIGLAGGTVTAMSADGRPSARASAPPASVTVLERTAAPSDERSASGAPAHREIPSSTAPVTPVTTLAPSTTAVVAAAAAPPAAVPPATGETTTAIAAPVITATPPRTAPPPRPATTVAANPVEAPVTSDAPVASGAEAPPDDVGIFATDVPTQAVPLAAPATAAPRVDTGATDAAAPPIPDGELAMPDLAVAPPPVEQPTPPVEPSTPPDGG